MKKPTLRDKLVKHLSLQYPAWIAKGELLRLTWRNENGVPYMADTASRALRDAEENSFIAVKYEGKNTQYKWIPYEMRHRYIRTSDRTGDKLFRE